MPATFDFAQLHTAIQVACGWADCHLYGFVPPRTRGPMIVPEAAHQERFDWGQVLLSDWFGARGERKRACGYWYDFGDDWFHDIELEEVIEHAEPELLDGARAFPPEDCGGTPGYERCVSLVERSRAADGDASLLSDDVADRLEWLAGWTPESFDLAAAREEFARAMQRRTVAAPWDDHDAAPQLEQAPEPKAPAEAVQLAERIGRIVGAGSLAPRGAVARTALPCWQLVARKKCRGQLCVQRVPHGSSSAIEWTCPGCGKVGLVTRWEGRRFDLSRRARGGQRQETVRIPRASYEALLADLSLMLSDERVLCAATPSAGQVALTGSREELVELHDATCAAANHAATAAQSKRLGKVIECLDVAFEERRTKKVYSAAVKRATKDLDLLEEELDALQRFEDTAQSVLMSALLSQKGYAQLLHRHARGIRGLRQLHTALATDDPVDLEAALEGFLEIRRQDGEQAYTDVASTYVSAFLVESSAHLARTRHVETVAALILRAARCAIEIAMKRGRGTSRELRQARALVLDLWCAHPLPALAPLGELVLGTVRLKRERTSLAKELTTRREASGDASGILTALLARLG